MLIQRNIYLTQIAEAFDLFSLCAILGPRQCGKTTLAHSYMNTLDPKTKVYFYDLEDPDHLEQLKNPKTALEPLDGLVVIDEIQRLPELFPYLRVLADYSTKKFLLLGSASGKLLQQSSESLAGRIDYIPLTPFSLAEADDPLKLWLRGGFPKAYLASSYDRSMRWRKRYINDFIERDLPSFGLSINAASMRHIFMMLAHISGGLLNYSEIGKSLGLTDMTVKRYMEILEQTFMIRLLRPFYENISKRQVKAPKVYIRDTGILHALLGITEDEWYIHPKRGASFESFVIEELIKKYGIDAECYFWRTQAGAELDLLIIKNGKRYGFEVKYSDAPKVTLSMQTALTDLKLDHLYVVTSGNTSYLKSDKISLLGIGKLAKMDDKLPCNFNI